MSPHKTFGNSLMVQWLGLSISTEGGTGLIPGWGTYMLHGTAKKLKQNTLDIMPSDRMQESCF